MIRVLMMDKNDKKIVWGLDLGLTSVGWAVVNANFGSDGKQLNQQGEIIDCGVRIFTAPEVGKTGESPAKERREARGSRRRTRRRARRMQAIRAVLYKNNLLSTFGQDDWISQYHCPPDISRVQGPWEWREEGLRRKLTPEEWAKTLLHLAKRRGFKSNRKGEGTDDKEAGAINKAIEGNSEIIGEGKEYITVGEMINKDLKYKKRKRNSSKKENDTPYKGMVTRAMLLAEINVLFAAQEKYGNPHVGFKEEYIKIWEKQIPYGERQDIEGMVGDCQFESGEKRAPRQSYTYERFTLLQKINQTEIWWQGEKRLLSKEPQELRNAVLSCAYQKAKVTHTDLRKALGMGLRDRFVGIQYKSEAQRVRKTIKAIKAIKYIPESKGDKEAKKEIPKTLFQDEKCISEVMDYIKTNGEIFYTKIREIAKMPENLIFPRIKCEDEGKSVKGLSLENYKKIKQKIGDSEWHSLCEKLNTEELEDIVSDIEEVCTYAKDNDEKLKGLKIKGLLSASALQALAKITLKDTANEAETFFEVKGWHMMRDIVLKNAGENGKDIWEQLEENAKGEKTDKPYLDIIAEAGLYKKTDKEIKQYLEDKEHNVLEHFGDNSESLLNAVSHMHIKEVGNVSILACQKINPYLMQGLLYHEACEKAGYNHSNPASSETADVKTRKLPGGDDWASIVKDMRNPRVVRAISQSRKIVNALVEKHGAPHDIHIELSRDLAKSFDERMKIKAGQEDFRADKAAAIERYKERTGSENAPSGDVLLKERLHKEQDGRCPYTGEYMELNRLEELGYVEIDHILPLSRSMDDSQTNKVLTFRLTNREKGNLIPHEWLEKKYGKDTDKLSHEWEKLKERVRHFRIGRREKMLTTSFSHEEAEEYRKKWVDSPTSKWIATSFKDILEKHLQLNKDDEKIHVKTRNGALTAYLRAHWGFIKHRDTHRHHALDAIVLAYSTQSMVQKVSRWSENEEVWSKDGKGLEIVDEQTGEMQQTKFNKRHKNPFPMPWETFHKDVLEKVNNVFISSPPRCKMSKEAHADTLEKIGKSVQDDAPPQNIPEVVRNGKPKSWAVLRTDIYQYEGKYYHICVRPYHRVKGELPTTITIDKDNEQSVIELLDEHFICSLYPGDAVLIKKKVNTTLRRKFLPEKHYSGVLWLKDEKGVEKEAVIVGYFTSTHDKQGQIHIKAHDNSWGKEGDFHPGIQGLLEIKKLHIPLLGGVAMDDFVKNKYQVKEKRPKLIKKPPHKA